ncbi:beta-ketoacyl synthase N-terminal-like domain-containing protein [Streptomyces sp. NPDC052042]|uniref:beta-ketoacyl synthase N-terminal-like domain-containing protein n=1 Tax=Streptomyces sp. NPDC052042 TaxID=3365683 RepID=UPI0037CD3FD8
MNADDTTRMAVTGVGVVSPRGFGPEAADRPRAAVPEGWFDHRTELGRRGYKYLPTAAQYFLAASNRALAAGAGFTGVPPQERGAAVGTNSGADALHSAMDATVMKSGAGDLSPATAPFFSINLFGSRMAMEHQLQGFNLTLTSPRVAGLEAVQTGARALRLGRASWLLAGATEEAADPLEPGVSAAESGAVALVLESADRAAARGATVLGHISVRSGYLPPPAAGTDRGRRRLARLLDGLAPEEADATPYGVTAVLDDSAVSGAVAAALGPAARHVPAGSGCLEPLLQTAGALAGGRERRPTAVVTAAAQGGVAVCWITPAHPTDDTVAGPRHEEA